ncbi:MAG: hypothetical protein ACON4H_18845 [Rubripirellula sp.]
MFGLCSVVGSYIDSLPNLTSQIYDPLWVLRCGVNGKVSHEIRIGLITSQDCRRAGVSGHISSMCAAYSVLIAFLKIPDLVVASGAVLY